jgi:hypothetical protein
MIGKICKTSSFKDLVEYLDKKDATLIGTNMYGRHTRELIAEFATVRDLNPSIKQPVLHASLSLSPGETLTDTQFREACETWIEKMGFDLAQNQYLIVRHQDTEHQHAHIAINRIDMLSGKVVVDSYERYRSQEIIRQIEQNYNLEPVAPSWQTFKNRDSNLEPSPHRQLTQEIETAAQNSSTMPELFRHLSQRHIRASVGFTRNGKPKGITYQMADGKKVAGNALGKAYSFPGLQKYLKVNYDPARDNRELTQIVQNSRHQQQLQPAETPAIRQVELNTPQPTVKQPPTDKSKFQQVWSPQYGIPALQDLIQAIPESPTPNLANRNSEQAQSTYQQWALLAREIYPVAEPKDIDPRIAFLMHLQEQSPKQITQVLAESPAVQELVKRDSSYAESYSQYCQEQSSNNQSNWQVELDNYLCTIQIECQIAEQKRIAKERQQREEIKRERELKLLEQWQGAAISLGKPESYIQRIREVAADYEGGQLLSDKVMAAREKDLRDYQQSQDWSLD